MRQRAEEMKSSAEAMYPWFSTPLLQSHWVQAVITVAPARERKREWSQAQREAPGSSPAEDQRHFDEHSSMARPPLELDWSPAGGWSTLESPATTLSRADDALRLCAVRNVLAPSVNATPGCEACGAQGALRGLLNPLAALTRRSEQL